MKKDDKKAIIALIVLFGYFAFGQFAFGEHCFEAFLAGSFFGAGITVFCMEKYGKK